MGELHNLPYKYRLFVKDEDREYVVVYHPTSNRVVIVPTRGLYEHIEIVTMNLINHGWKWESEGKFIAHEDIHSNEETDQTV